MMPLDKTEMYQLRGYKEPCRADKMTVARLIAMLQRHPDDAEVRIYDVDTSAMEPVTGCVSGPEFNSGVYVVDLDSDC